MTIGLDRHLYSTSFFPDLASAEIALTEMAGPRAEGRTVVIQNTSDTSVTVELCAAAAKTPIDPWPFLHFVLVPGDETPQTVIINGTGFYPTIGTHAKDYKGTFGPLAGSLPGLNVWIGAEEPATSGAVHIEITCRFDS